MLYSHAGYAYSGPAAAWAYRSWDVSKACVHTGFNFASWIFVFHINTVLYLEMVCCNNDSIANYE